MGIIYDPKTHSDQENLRYAWLRAVEWGRWPLFVSQSIAPILFIFFPWWEVTLTIFVLNLLWSFIRYRYVGLFLVNMGSYADFLKWLTIPVAVIHFFISKNYHLALLSLFWPLVLFPLGVFTPTQVGVLQKIIMNKFGYFERVNSG